MSIYWGGGVDMAGGMIEAVTGSWAKITALIFWRFYGLPTRGRTDSHLSILGANCPVKGRFCLKQLAPTPPSPDATLVLPRIYLPWENGKVEIILHSSLEPSPPPHIYKPINSCQWFLIPDPTTRLHLTHALSCYGHFQYFSSILYCYDKQCCFAL